jgi:hypothetical protein
MRIRYQADADLKGIILLAAVRREPAMDFQTAFAAGLAHLQDLDVLAIAAKEGRLLVTHDQRTMPRHFADFIGKNKSSGVLMVPQHIPAPVVVEDLLLIWNATEAEEWINRICFRPL